MCIEDLEFKLSLFVACRVRNFYPKVKIVENTIELGLEPVEKNRPFIRIYFTPGFPIWGNNLTKLKELIDSQLALTFTSKNY